MKNFSKAISVAFVGFLLIGNVSAQDAYTGTTAKKSYTSIPAIEKTLASSNASEDIMANFPVVESRFSSLFPTATNPQWSAIKENLWVSFVSDGRKGSASFTQKGKMNYIILSCGLEQLPTAFSKTIQKDYSLYKVYNAIEIKAHDAVAYQVILENAVNFITLKYAGEEVVEISKVNKTK